jgi:hypothetical protein
VEGGKGPVAVGVKKASDEGEPPAAAKAPGLRAPDGDDAAEDGDPGFPAATAFITRALPFMRERAAFEAAWAACSAERAAACSSRRRVSRAVSAAADCALSCKKQKRGKGTGVRGGGEEGEGLGRGV